MASNFKDCSSASAMASGEAQCTHEKLPLHQASSFQAAVSHMGFPHALPPISALTLDAYNQPLACDNSVVAEEVSREICSNSMQAQGQLPDSSTGSFHRLLPASAQSGQLCQEAAPLLDCICGSDDEHKPPNACPGLQQQAAIDGTPQQLGELADYESHNRAFLSRRLRTIVVVNLVSVCERLDEQILPSVSRFLACSFSAAPHQLGMITFGRALVQALASPFGGLAGHCFDRVRVLTVGCSMWAFFSLCFAFSQNLQQGIFFWAFNGIGLSLIIPNSQSLVADYYPCSQRGRAFGTLQLTSALGGMVGSLYATNVSSHTPFGITGWRFTFLSVAVLSGFIGMLTCALGCDPRYAGGKAKHAAPVSASNKAVAKGATISQCKDTELSTIAPSARAAGLRGKSAPNEAEPLLPSSLKPSDRGLDKDSMVLAGSPSSKSGMHDSSSSVRKALGDRFDHRLPLLHHTPTGYAQLQGNDVMVVHAGGSLGQSGFAATANSRQDVGDNSTGLSDSVELASTVIIKPGGGDTDAGAALHLLSSEGPLEQHQHVPQPLSLRRVLHMLTIPSFLVIILQGVVGSTPWNALVFLTLYLQLLGMSDFAASVLNALLLAGVAVGGLMGGWIGDRAAERFPNTGRIVITQFSVFIGVPACALIFKGLPENGEPLTVFLYGAVLLITGLLHDWAGPACNQPIFAEIVPEDLRNMVYAFDRSFEGGVAALGAPLVGFAAERWFGFHGTATTAGCSEDNGTSPHAISGSLSNPGSRHAPDLAKARALGSALLLFTAVPWGLCTLLYTGLYFTYPEDRDRAAAIAHQAQQAHAAQAQAYISDHSSEA